MACRVRKGRLESDRKKPAVQFETPGDDSKPDEDSKMEVDDVRRRSQRTCVS